MPLLQVENLSKSFGALELFRGLSFTLEEGKKAGLIAPNGAGKSTLLKMLAGRESIDSGTVTFLDGTRVGYLPQQSDFSDCPDILTAALGGIRPELRKIIKEYEDAEQSGEAGRLTKAAAEMDRISGWQIEGELTAMLDRFRLKDPYRSTKGLSGGETKRIALASVLLGSPDLLILDEPTNHLDPDIIEWLEDTLSTKSLALLVVTHDRYFLDSVCDTIFELDEGSLFVYEGNYSYYTEKRAERLEMLRAEQQTLRNIYRRELEWMRSTPQARSGKAKYRKDAFHETESRLRTINDHTGPDLEASDVYIGKKIFAARHVSKAFGKKEVIKDFTYDFARRDHVGIIGPNGAGKTTLVKLIMGRTEPTGGSIEIGETVRFGYFSQEAKEYPPEKKVIEVITEKHERITLGGGGTMTAMQFLNRFLFPPKRQQDYVEKLSGGEKRRLQLCEVLMENPNFLVLDEPTNDLDIPTIQVLEDYLDTFNGCLLIVSHDRFFMDRLARHLFVLTGDGLISDFPGNYTDYRLMQKEEAARAKTEETKKPKEPPKNDRPVERKKKRTYKEQKEFEALEESLPEIEKQLQELSDKMNSGTLSPSDLVEAGEAYGRLKEEQEEKEMRWLELSELE